MNEDSVMYFDDKYVPLCRNPERLLASMEVAKRLAAADPGMFVSGAAVFRVLPLQLKAPPPPAPFSVGATFLVLSVLPLLPPPHSFAH